MKSSQIINMKFLNNCLISVESMGMRLIFLPVVFIVVLLIGLGSNNQAIGVMHNCVGGGGNGGELSTILKTTLNSTKSNENLTQNQISLVNDMILHLMSFCSINASVIDKVANDNSILIGDPEKIKSDIAGGNNSILIGDPEKIKSEIVETISRNTELNSVQKEALNKILDNAIILQEATADPTAPKPEISFEIYNQTVTLKW
jgi:hypothetical protein